MEYNLTAKRDLKARCYDYSIKTVKFISSLPNIRAYWVISDQLWRSATSIGANIIEGKAATSKKDFINYYTIALKSANETSYWLGILADALYVNSDEAAYLRKETDEISRIIVASLLTLKGQRKTATSGLVNSG